MRGPELTPEEMKELEKQIEAEKEDWRERSHFTVPPFCLEGLGVPEEEI